MSFRRILDRQLMHDLRRPLIALAFVGMIAGAFALSALVRSTAFTSAEVKFADESKAGLSIVPASCPSSPHGSVMWNPTAGAWQTECDCTGPDCTPSAPVSGCVLKASPYSVEHTGDPVTLSWSSGDPLNYPGSGFGGTGFSGTISNGWGNSIAEVSGFTGSIIVYPGYTSTFTLTGTYYFEWGGTTYPAAAGNCDATVTVGGTGTCPNGQPPAGGLCSETQPGDGGGGCPVGQVLVGGVCISQCVGQVSLSGSCVVAGCPAGKQLVGNLCVAIVCAQGWTLQGNLCVPPPSLEFVPFDGMFRGRSFASTGHLQVRPTLLRAGDEARIYWNVNHASGCTVSGTNGFSSSAASSGSEGQPSIINEKTVFSLHCNGLVGASTPSIDETATVNIAPVFQEK